MRGSRPLAFRWTKIEIIDTSLIENSTLRIEQNGFGCDGGFDLLGQCLSNIYQDRGGEPIYSGMFDGNIPCNLWIAFND